MGSGPHRQPCAAAQNLLLLFQENGAVRKYEQKENFPIVEGAELLYFLHIVIEFLYKKRYTRFMEMLESFPKFNPPVLTGN